MAGYSTKQIFKGIIAIYMNDQMHDMIEWTGTEGKYHYWYQHIPLQFREPSACVTNQNEKK